MHSVNGKNEWIAYHGWGFDDQSWNAWGELDFNGDRFNSFDRGYFGEPEEASFNDNGGLNILMAHSFGLHLCPAEQLKIADVLIIFGGFRTFHPRAAQFQHRSRQILKQMKQAFRDQPEEVLRNFMQNTFYPQNPPAISFDHIVKDRLMEDLRYLDHSEIDVENLKQARKICILHGSEDGIVHKSKGRELYNLCEEKASYFEVRGAGHALPFTHREQCWSFIKPEIERVGD